MRAVDEPLIAGRDTGNDRLTDRVVVPFLVERSLLDARAIVDGDVEIIDMSRRNVNFRVTALGQDVLVKQGVGAERIESIGREAAFLKSAADSLKDHRLRSHLPIAHVWDAERCVLAFCVAPETHSLAEHHLRTGHVSAELAQKVGAALRRLHRWGAGGADLHLDSEPPPVLSLHLPELRVFERMSGSGLEVIKILQQAPVLCAGLDELRHGWHPSSIIHGDMKWDNVVLLPKPDGERGVQVQLVDWELVQFGDPLWDVASFLAQYLDVWIGSIPVAANTPQASAARIPIARLQPATRRFWQSCRSIAQRDARGC